MLGVNTDEGGKAVVLDLMLKFLAKGSPFLRETMNFIYLYFIYYFRGRVVSPEYFFSFFISITFYTSFYLLFQKKILVARGCCFSSWLKLIQYKNLKDRKKEKKGKKNYLRSVKFLFIFYYRFILFTFINFIPSEISLNITWFQPKVLHELTTQNLIFRKAQ